MHTQHVHAVSYESDYVSFEVTDRTIVEGVPGDTAMICMESLTRTPLRGSIAISDIGNAAMDGTF